MASRKRRLTRKEMQANRIRETKKAADKIRRGAPTPRKGNGIGKA